VKDETAHDKYEWHRYRYEEQMDTYFLLELGQPAFR